MRNFLWLNKVSIFFVIDKIWIGKKIRFIFFYHFRANEQQEIFVDIFVYCRINVETIFILLIILLNMYKRKDINTSWKKDINLYQSYVTKKKNFKIYKKIENNIQLIFLSFRRKKKSLKNKNHIILFNHIFLEKIFLKKINVFHVIFFSLECFLI